MWSEFYQDNLKLRHYLPMPLIDFSHPSPYGFAVTEFRSDIPTIPLPDREAWKRLTGKTPIRVDADQRFVNRALACIERDKTTLLRDKAIHEHVTLESVCMGVWASIDPHPGDLDVVLFDPETKAFWLYPA